MVAPQLRTSPGPWVSLAFSGEAGRSESPAKKASGLPELSRKDGSLGQDRGRNRDRKTPEPPGGLLWYQQGPGVLQDGLREGAGQGERGKLGALLGLTPLVGSIWLKSYIIHYNQSVKGTFKILNIDGKT